MNVKMGRLGFEGIKYFQGILLSFLVIQIISYLLHVIGGYPLLKLGWMFLLFLAVVSIITLYVLGININQLNKNILIFALIIFLCVVGLAVLLPTYIPEIFSITNLNSSIDYSELLKSQLNAVLSNAIGG